MTYGANPQRTARDAEYQRVLFGLPPHAGWREGMGRVRRDVVFVAVLLPTLPLLTPASGSSITVPAFPEATKVWQEVAVSTVRSFELQVCWVKQLYAFRRPDEVSELLQAHPFLVPLLLEAHGKIAQYFGPSPQVVLEVVTDPEAPDDRELFAFIRTNLPPDKALARLDRLDEEWWLDTMDRGEAKLCIDVEFR